TAYGMKNLASSPCLIFVHGFKGFKDWGFWNFTSNHFAEKGYFVLSFNFSHNGIGNNSTEFTELDKFADNTISLEIDELNELIENYRSGFFGKTNNEKIGILGHSRGGAVSILTAAGNKSLSALIVWASVAKIDRYTERQKKEWREKGYVEILNARTKQLMRLNLTLLDDIEKNKDSSLNLEKALISIKIPFLIVHGDQDVTVPVKEAEQLYDWSDKKNTEMEIIKSAGHTFNIVHPFSGSNEKFDMALTKTEKFFNKNLFKEINDD
ncbi:MAG TPA: prolyl oligopeptidase family serine peptidase, partial [Ignavibacteriaceae bacterium]|nr:prolyl oligopeptidase family serine peptidase [Ignavibacteriaceae bacterium]